MKVDVDVDELLLMVELGYVRRVLNPSGSLALFNYTESCAYEGVWNPTTRACRGLILDLDCNVVALPFPKFFNYGEPNAPDLDLDAEVVVTDKQDGSLGILYPGSRGDWAVATRGSFTSEQALHATAVWRDRYETVWEPPAGVTCLFEIIYPSNRIVVDYGDLDDLVLLGARDIGTGACVEVTDWPGPRTETHPYSTLRAALEAPPRPGQEGLVVFFPDSGDRVKLKQADYVAIHRVVFGLTARRVWEHAGVHDLLGRGLGMKQVGIALQMDLNDMQGIIDGDADEGGHLATSDSWLDSFLAIVPEEFGEWAIRKNAEIVAAVGAWESHARVAFDEISVNDPGDRRFWAEAIKQQPREIQGALFSLLDGKDIRQFAWRAVRPDHETYKALEEEGS